VFSELGLSGSSGRSGHRDFRLSRRGQGREREVDRLAAAAAAVYLGEFVVGAGEADLESFDLAEPAFTSGFGDAGGEVDVSTTMRAASSRNSGVNFRYFPDT
jgi:hypothetical protein